MWAKRSLKIIPNNNINCALNITQAQYGPPATRCLTSATTGPACTGATAPRVGIGTSATAHKPDSRGQLAETVNGPWL